MVWGDLFNRPVCGFVKTGNGAANKQLAPGVPYTQLQTDLNCLLY